MEKLPTVTNSYSIVVVKGWLITEHTIEEIKLIRNRLSVPLFIFFVN